MATGLLSGGWGKAAEPSSARTPGSIGRGWFRPSAPSAGQLRLAGATGMTGLAGDAMAGSAGGRPPSFPLSGTAGNPASVRAQSQNHQRLGWLEQQMNAAYARGDFDQGDEYADAIEKMGFDASNPFGHGYTRPPGLSVGGGPEPPTRRAARPGTLGGLPAMPRSRPVEPKQGWPEPKPGWQQDEGLEG